MRIIILTFIIGCQLKLNSAAFNPGDIIIEPKPQIRSSFVGIGINGKSQVSPPKIKDSKPRPPGTSQIEKEMKEQKKKFCREQLTPKPDCDLRTTEGLYGRWYVVSEPGLAQGSPVCEKVDFFPETTQHNFLKILQLKLKDGTWVSQNQNGTLISCGKILLELDLEDTGTPKKPRKQMNYTLIDYDPDHYMTAFFCLRGEPTVPVLLRSPNPTQEVWAKIFAGVIRAGIDFSWMDLFCQPSPQRPPPTSRIVYQAPPKPISLRSSLGSDEIIF